MENQIAKCEGDVSLMLPKQIKYLLETRGPFCDIFLNDYINPFGSFYGYMMYTLKSLIFLLSHR